MDNHMHISRKLSGWQILGDHIPAIGTEDVQRDFLRFTSQQILKILRNEKSPLLEELLVNAKDRKHQVWQRNAFSMPIYTESFFFQKLEYIHNNPVVAGYCKHAESYEYSSAAFYFKGVTRFTFLKHFQG